MARSLTTLLVGPLSGEKPHNLAGGTLVSQKFPRQWMRALPQSGRAVASARGGHGSAWQGRA
eukprot:8365101-Alexandrium_andersonii.AAC.1